MAELGGSRDLMSFRSVGDLTAKRYHIARSAGDRFCGVASVATDSKIVGIIDNAPSSGQAAAVCYGGETKLVAGGAAVSSNAWVSVNSAGRAVDAASGDMVVARALQASAADGDVISVLAYKPFRLSGAI